MRFTNSGPRYRLGVSHGQGTSEVETELFRGLSAPSSVPGEGMRPGPSGLQAWPGSTGLRGSVCSAAGLVPEPESQVPQTRESDA